MEFMSRGQRPSQPTPTGQPSAAHTPGSPSTKARKLSRWDFMRLASAALLVSIAILILAVVASLIWGGSTNESKYINKKDLQAVFLNGGQVYFGHITNLNEKYVHLSDIYYLRVNNSTDTTQTTATTTGNDISLVKLGCELHAPTDEMLINRDQVVFWENLKTDGQVATAVAKYIKDNPNGQKCDQTAQQTTTQSTTTTPVQPTTTTPTTTTTTPKTTTTTPTTKK